MTIIKLCGNIDANCAACLRRAFIAALFDQRTPRLVVDLVRTTAIDSRSVAAFAAARHTAHDMQVQFAVRCPDPLIAAELDDLACFPDS